MSAPYTQEQLDFIKEARKTMTARQIADAYKTRFGASKDHNSINMTCLRRGWNAPKTGRFQKGSKPWNDNTKGQGLTGANKGNFQKGHIPHNHRPIGSERIDSREGYLYVKTAEPNTWKAKHILLWESKNGPVPPHHVIRFIDDDVTNISPENLELTSRHESLQLNIHGLKKAAPELKPVIKMIAKIKVSLYDKTKEATHG